MNLIRHKEGSFIIMKWIVSETIKVCGEERSIGEIVIKIGNPHRAPGDAYVTLVIIGRENDDPKEIWGDSAFHSLCLAFPFIRNELKTMSGKGFTNSMSGYGALSDDEIDSYLFSCI